MFVLFCFCFSEKMKRMERERYYSSKMEYLCVGENCEKDMRGVRMRDDGYCRGEIEDAGCDRSYGLVFLKWW